MAVSQVETGPLLESAGAKESAHEDFRHGLLDLCAPESAELKTLRRPSRSLVLVSAGVDKDEFFPQGLAKALGVMPRHGQSTAFLGAVKREGTDDGMASVP